MPTGLQSSSKIFSTKHITWYFGGARGNSYASWAGALYELVQTKNRMNKDNVNEDSDNVDNNNDDRDNDVDDNVQTKNRTGQKYKREQEDEGPFLFSFELET